MRQFSMKPLLIVTISATLAYAQPSVEITRYALPEDVTYPEGIALDSAGAAFYTASAATGAVIRVALDSRKATTIAAAGTVLPAEPFPAALGMKLDNANRLWLAGGRTGRMAVLDARTGTVLKRFQTPASSSSLINDVALVGEAAYFTDSLTPTLWRITTASHRIGELEAWIEFAGTPLQYGSGANLNGIAATADGRHLIVVQMNKGLLYRVGIGDRQIAPIDAGGAALTGADGLVLDGRTLYVVRQTEQEIVTMELSDDLTTGRVLGRFKDPALAWPATAAKQGDRLLVVNTQFNKRSAANPDKPFAVLSIPLSVLARSRQ
jgi:Cu-Zn family superoxide dismutase